jgi:hypothetical protein
MALPREKMNCHLFFIKSDIVCYKTQVIEILVITQLRLSFWY